MPDATQLRASLLQSLPEYMVPAHFVVLDQLPLTSNGKIDRKALPLPDMTRSDIGYVAPRTPSEEIMAGIWAEILKVDKVGIHDDFFLLGGHSLLATQMMSRVQSALQIGLPLRALFEAPSIAALMLKVAAADTGVSAPPLRQVNRDAPLSLSFAQQRLWFLDQYESRREVYNIPAGVRLSGHLDVLALTRALNEIVRRHEALRTSFAVVDDLPVQIIAPVRLLPLETTDLSGLPVADRETQLRLQLRDEASTPFDLAAGPLIRYRLIRLAEQEHVLLLTMHHIVSDGWSMGIVVREVAALYQAFMQDLPSPLAELPIQYADFAQWQRQWLSGEVLGQQLSYWKQQLADSPSLLTLPTDRPRPSSLSHRGAMLPFALPAALVSGLQGLSRQTHSTLFMTLSAAFNLLLARYSGQSDICIGTPIANRNRTEIEPLIGFFVNTLVLRTQVDLHAGFHALLQQVRQHTLDAYAHQDVPFEQLVEALQPERHASYTPLFQVMLVLQNTPMDELALPGLVLKLLDNEISTAKFDITLALTEAEEGLQGYIEYSTDLFELSTIERMAGHFTNLLQAIVADPNLAVGELAMLDPPERQQLLYGFNDTATVYPNVQANAHSLHQLFEAQVLRSAGHTAVVYEGVSLSYAELNAQANRLARHLRQLGVGPEVLVGLCVERSLEMIVGLYGILKAGGAYVPLDPAYPSERLATILEDAQPAVVLTQRRLRAHVPAGPGLAVFCLDSDIDTLASYGDDNLEHQTQPNHLAYVIYTSGSTGKPKGVGIDQQGIVNRLQWMQQAYPLSAADRVLQKTPFSFDVSVWEFFWPLIEGATLVVAKPGGHQDVAYLAELIDSQGITTLHFVPPMLDVFLNELQPGRGKSLRQVMCSGQALPLELQQRFFASWDHVALHNLYGPTEASVDVTYWPCQKDSTLNCVPIGKPIANIQIHILDESLNPVPVGVVGHLYIAGIGLARGYINRPELTAKTFIPNPFSAVAGARMYLSGDLARYLADGSIEYLGRSDHQVKIRGLRIELGEIEATLAALDAVRDAVVLAREDSAGSKRLVAYLVAHDGQVLPDEAQLRTALLKSLPEYMVPEYFVALGSMPLTANGKVNRNALPAPEMARHELEYIAPRTPTEQSLAAIWAELLQLDRVGVHDDFFALGGHSLLATQLMSRIGTICQVKISLRTIFESPTLAGMAAAVAQAGAELTAASSSSLSIEVPSEAYPLSFAQQRLWFLDQLEGQRSAYNIPLAIRLKGQLNRQALQDALNDIVHRHDALRAYFDRADGMPVQRIMPRLDLVLALNDLRHGSVQQRQMQAHGLMLEETRIPFDLQAGPLIRGSLLQLDEQEYLLLLTMHHIASDGWSMGILVREVSTLYASHALGSPSTLPELPMRYVDFASWQRQWLSGEVLERQLNYWKQQLAGSPTLLTLPTDYPRPATQSQRGATHHYVLPAELSVKLQALSRKTQTTLFMTLCTAFNVLLARYSGQSDICIGTPIANRNRAEIEGMIGFFVNTLVLRTQVDLHLGFTTLLKQVRANTLDAYTHQDVQFEQLVEALQPERDTSYSPLFQVMLVLQNAPMTKLALPGLQLELVPSESTTAKFDLSLALTEGKDGLHGDFEYSTDLFELSTIERMAGHFTNLLQAIVADPTLAVGELAMLDPPERQQLLYGFNDTATVYPNVQANAHSLHQLFEAQVLRSAGHTAVVYEGVSLSYAELNAQANRLARHLRQLGVGPEVLVGLCVERSLEMIVGLYGILKAGGAYVPLDPAYPSERLATILEDAQPAVVLTQRRLRAHVPAGPGLAVFCLDSDIDTLASYGDDNLEHQTQPNHLAYVIYTSGSTGKPKGVGIDQQGIVNRLQWMQQAYPLSAADRVLQKTPFSFDVSVWEFFWPLIEGATLVVAKPGGHQDVAYLAELIDSQGITTLHFVPPMLDVFLNELQPGRGKSLRQVRCSGQALPLELQQRFFASWDHVALHNLYGPTEASVDVTYWPCQKDSTLNCVPIGKPIANIQIHILDESLNPVPVGVVGHLYIAGIGLARGYINRPELTAKTFIPNPFSAVAGARMYLSGDLARYLADGSIEYLGRSDHQVKIRGLRIELGEIEATLAALDAVRDAVVLAREDSAGSKRLVAYLVAHDGQVLPDEAQLRTALLKSLPEYMVPSYFVALEQMPLTPNGKVNRNALPAPDMTRDEVDYVAPRTADERRMAEIWSDILKVDKIGLHDDFFELGGHSLLATQLMSRIGAAFEVEVSLRTIFDAPTLVEMVSQVVPASAEDEDLAQVMVEPDQAYPLSFAQQRLWFLDQLEGQNSTYNIPLSVRLKGRLDRAALQGAINDVAQRHDALRVHFENLDGTPMQRVKPRLDLALGLDDLRHLAPKERKARAQWLILDEARTPFDLQTGPLMRGSLLQLEEQEHLLLLTVHHIVFDGWSIGILVQEVAALYASRAQGVLSSLPALPMRYVDFASWQRQWLSGEVLERQLNYWKQQLAGSPALLSLPSDRPRPAVQSQHGATLSYAIPLELSIKLQALSRKAQGTLFMTLCAAFNVLLARYSGQSDICVGTPIANRNRAEIEGMIGFFVNTLVLRTQVDLRLGFSTLLKQVRANTLDAYTHQDVQFEQLVEALQPERHTSYSPLFQAMLVLQNAPMGELVLPGLSMSVLDSENSTAKFDITLTLTESDAGLQGDFEYSTDLFDASTIERMADHFTRLLYAIVADPTCPLDDLVMLGDDERRLMLSEWNDSLTDFSDEGVHAQSIQQLFEAQAARTPGEVAVIHEGTALSYAQLNEQANRLAHQLLAIGVRPDARVAICAERGVDMMVAILATLKAGGAYVPMDPAYPLDRLAYMLEDSQPLVLLTCLTQQARARLEPALAQPAAQAQAMLTLDLHADVSRWAQQPADNPGADATGLSSRHLAYVIYTSGSTGQPKGVMVEHATVLNLIHNHVRTCALSAADRVLQFASFAFDASIEEIFPPLTVGATVVLRPAELMAPDESFWQLLRDMRITVAELPTAFWHQWAQQDGPASQAGYESLRLVVVGGEKAEKRHLEQWRQSALGRVHWLNTYGPTEATVYATALMMHEHDALPAGEIPIGRPVANTQIYILDNRLQPVPMGVAGEIYIGGAGVARGYLNRPQLTAERFVIDPFGKTADGRLYKTGDLARYRPDGHIEYLGRNDFQVKIRGFRIELGEIEAKLAAIGGVREAVVLAREEADGDRRLVAYVVAEDAIELNTETLRAHLATQLAGYMLPSAYVMLDRLPLTANGKVDRKAFPAPGPAYLEAAYVAPRTPAEEIMAGIWAEILKLDRVGIHDDFFAMGGHSLLATQLMSRVQRALQVSLPLRALFEAPSIAALMLKLAQADAGDSAPPILPVSREAPLPLSFAQTRLWFLDQLERPNALYNMPAAVRLRGRLDVDALTRTLNEIVRRHEALRTCFAGHDGAPVQIITPRMALPLVIDDLSHLPAHEREASAQRWSAQEAQTPFDLETDLLIRGALLRLDEDEHLLLLTMHHIVSDGWSFAVLVNEIAALYAAYTQGQASPLAELPIQYADFAQWQRQWLSGEVLERQLSYWKRQLAGGPSLLMLPTDRPRPALPSHRGATLAFMLPQPLVTGLQTLSRQTQSTLFMTLSAAFSVLLARYSGQHDICIGTPIANRNRTEIENLIGFFVNTLVLRTQVDLALDFNALLQQVRQHTLDAYAHQDVPFEQLVEALQPERHTSYSPLFQVMLVLQNLPIDELVLPELSLSVLDSESTTAKFDITLTLAEDLQGMQGYFEYSTDLFEASTIERMADHFTRLLQSIVAHPGVAVGELAMLGDDERQQLLVTLNESAMVYPDIQPDTQTLHQLFEMQAARSPGQVAVLCEGESLTYAQLNARANRLARHLRSLGVRPTALVGLCIERSLDMMVGLFGILKAGGAYLPLDPAYPPERLQTILADAKPMVLLTQAPLREQVPTLPGLPVFCLDSDAEALAGYADDDLGHAAQSTDAAYVIYTSGSTGKPKGVMVAHGSLLNYVGYVVREYLGEHMSGAVVSSPLGFDATVTTLLPPLLVGKPVVLLADNEQTLPQLSARLFAPGAAWLFKITPAHLEALSYLDQAEAVDETGKPGEAAQCIVVGGEQLSLAILRRWKGELLPAATFVNEYGPTETTVGCCVWRLSDAAELHALDGVAAPIGRPIGNTRLYVLDEGMQLQPIGSVGELYIGGKGVALGYLGRASLTEERFVIDRFSGEAGARLYRTGDLVRYRADGELEFLGRRDDQVKLRGFRIELGEIEQQLAELADVQAAAVALREDAPGEKRLVAYVVPMQVPRDREQEAALMNSYRLGLAQRLPDYMMPSAYVVLSSLPLTVNGKVNRKALPLPDIAQGDAMYVAPRTATEQVIADIWVDILKVNQVSVFDDFFRLGGHSLLAVQLVSQLRKRAAIDMALRDLFSYPTLDALAAFLDSSKTASRHSNLVPIRAHGSSTPLFLIHPIGGEVQYAFDLAQYLDAEQPVYALAARGFAMGETPQSSIVEMAASSLGAMRQVQETGPYLIAGWSLGGMIAYEIAHQLLAAGEAVDFVGMIDSGSSEFLRASWQASQADEYDECRALLNWVVDQHPQVADARQHPAYDELIALAKRKDSDAMIAVCRREALLPASFDMALVKRILALYQAGAGAAESYQAPAAAMTVNFFAADRYEGEDLALGWGGLLGPWLEVTSIGGSHYSIVQPPHIKKLAREISAKIKPDGTSVELLFASQ
ncbi:non-ribosomal peptide synthase/polyketide synthase [Dyella silvatica]|uniref:non-ribosomal peptide synthase/polyketide synthase n=1 Tax=Dyella silvatica TaxID=2992128 RepID=UPI002B1CDC59|nr:non-ribosomal peptide synthase/polyketide synthase [Dyella silvatica]